MPAQRRAARRRVPKAFFDYADAGSYSQETLRANRADLEDFVRRCAAGALDAAEIVDVGRVAGVGRGRGMAVAAGLLLAASMPQPDAVDVAGLAELLSAGNPAPYAGVVHLPHGAHPAVPAGGVSVVTASPELFLRRDGDVLESGPIKGTGRTPDDLLDKDASVVTISISTTRMAAENYGYMAPVKAALDSSLAFLAKSFSQFSRVRFNADGRINHIREYNDTVEMVAAFAA